MRTTYYTLQQVIARTSLSSSTIYRWEKLGIFPQRTKLGPRRVAWRSDQIEDWMTASIE
ncbi:hypothetical protein GCM10007421_37550 [Halopseudomonas oceani]|jgi:prophage regulatory protein|uniref:Transcriptional regulator n=1 Tax=Halopseudomonas oceani TaxID=1708783 RepID=A0A2P4ESJ5_9GAMM|nr:transcriptional regulator [Halopseudomonas oceani]GGE59377.1 hypothetical protein GCM10007421_37550 [Halopseudomonas oceani]